MWTIVQLTLGFMDKQDAFYTGNQEETFFLRVLYYLATFILIVHLLNMLIALMGNQLSANTENQNAMKLQERLKFVLDKWAYKNIVSRELKQNDIKYIICAFVPEQDNKHQSVLKEISNAQAQFEEKFNHF